MIKYKAYIQFEFGKIEKTEIKRETDHSVWLTDKRREAKENIYHKYFDTWEEAHKCLKNLVDGRVTRAISKVNYEVCLRDKIYAMEEK